MSQTFFELTLPPASAADVATNTAAISALQTSKADKDYTLRAHTGTTDTLVLADDGKLITSSNASAVTQTIPANASVALPVGSVIQVLQLGAGQVSFAITSDTLQLPSGFVAKARGQYSLVTLIKIASTTWVAAGDLSFI